MGRRGDTDILVRGDRLLSHGPLVIDFTGGSGEQTPGSQAKQFIALHGLALARSLVHNVSDPEPVYDGMHFTFDNLDTARNAAQEMARISIGGIRTRKSSGLIFGSRDLDDLEEHLPINVQTNRFDNILAADAYPIALVVEGGFGTRCVIDRTDGCTVPIQLGQDLAPASYDRLMRRLDYRTFGPPSE